MTFIFQISLFTQIINMMLSFGTNAKFKEYTKTFFEVSRVAQTKKGEKT